MTEATESPFRWNRSETGHTPLNLAATLASGQNFRWRVESDGTWFGVAGDSVLALRQDGASPDGPLLWQTFPVRDRWELVADYLRLDVDLDRLMAEWIDAEPAMADAAAAFRGLRILRQPPVECFFGFQCASCNTVVKIERSVQRLAERYGEPILDGDLPRPFYQFPTIEALAEADESHLRSDLWGYRAPRVIALARILRERPAGWLLSLRLIPYREAHAALAELPGIGPKVADCICAFALDKDEALPVDTHIRQIACRLFAPTLAGKSLTPRVYEEIAAAYRDRFGAYAAWAQQYLFFGELRRSGKR